MAQSRDPARRGLSIRRRWLWPSYLVIVLVGAFMALQPAWTIGTPMTDLELDERWAMLLISLLLGLMTFDLSISARLEMARERSLEAVVLWVAVGLGAIAALTSLFVWLKAA
jgi:hypothetical protein